MQDSRHRSNRKAIEKRKGQKPSYPAPTKNAPKRILKRLQPSKPLKRRNALKRVYKPTGELALFKQIYEELEGISQITQHWLPFDVKNFIHILGKKAYPKFRLYKDNIVHGEYDFHHLYDNSSKKKALKEFPQAEWIYNKKQTLKEFYNSKKV